MSEKSKEPKGYVIARVAVSDPEAYAAYAKAAGEAQKKYGARVLVRAGEYVTLEGDSRTRNIVLEFESFAKAQAYYHSIEYQAARLKREYAAVADIIAIQGAED